MSNITPKELIVRSKCLDTIMSYIDELVLEIAKGSTNTIVQSDRIIIEFWAHGYPGQTDSEDIKYLKDKLRGINLDEFYIRDLKEAEA